MNKNCQLNRSFSICVMFEPHHFKIAFSLLYPIWKLHFIHIQDFRYRNANIYSVNECFLIKRCYHSSLHILCFPLFLNSLISCFLNHMGSAVIENHHCTMTFKFFSWTFNLPNFKKSWSFMYFINHSQFSKDESMYIKNCIIFKSMQLSLSKLCIFSRKCQWCYS